MDTTARIAARIAATRPIPLSDLVAGSTTGVGVEVVGSKGDRYVVRLGPDGAWSCTCKAFEFGAGKACKHILHIQELQEWDRAIRGVKNADSKQGKDNTNTGYTELDDL